MEDKRSSVPKGTLYYCLAVIVTCAAILWFASGTFRVGAETTQPVNSATAPAVFAADAGSLGAIPDSDDTSNTCQNNSTTHRDVTFTVSGLTGTVKNVAVDFNADHSYLQDLEVTLMAPGGSPSLLLFSATGTTATGPNSCDGSYSTLSSSNTYTFADTASANWWTTASTGIVVPTSTNRTVVSGIGGTSNPPAETSLDDTFGGLSSSAANGTWTLRFRDRGIGDTGTVTAANLTITTSTGTTSLDFDKDGKSDFAILRDLSPPMLKAGQQSDSFRFDTIRSRLKYEFDKSAKSKSESANAVLTAPPVGSNVAWWIHRSSDDGAEVASFGEAATDFYVPADYDGDGITDVAVWRPVASGQPNENAFLYILESGTSTVTTIDFGQDGDDPAIVGDYDGDGKADPAVYRCPSPNDPVGQCYFFYRGSSNNPSGNITYVPWGFGNALDFYVNPGDFDGDGKYDFCIQRANPDSPAQGQFVLLRSHDFGVEYIDWGKADDIIVPGDYDGDGRADFAVSRYETINGVAGRSYYILQRDGGGTGGTPIRWGIAGDYRTPGDYDGDGKTDIAIFRPSTDPNANYFYVLRSSDKMLETFEWGQCPTPGVGCDIPLANWNVH